MNRTAVEEIKARIPIEELVGSYVKLEKAGKSFKARCPFHNEKSPSFFVSPERGGYYCFGCNAKGDIFSFVEQFEGLDFRGALKVLAEKAGVKLTADPKADGERDRLYQIMEDAASYFEDQFARSAEAKEYVKGRGITDETRTAFRIGWAPEGWRNLHAHLKGKGYSDGIIERAGLAKKKEDGSDFYDRFRGRVMFPISDSSGRVIAFSGRILPKLDDGKAAKYLNSPDTPLYDKSLVLYGLDKAKSEIRRMGYAIFVEGQMDLVLSHQAGIRNAVAASGTAVTDESMGESGTVSNLGLVRRLSANMIIAFDSDSAGRKAALRAAGIALSMGMDVKIADLVGGKDPADLIRENPENWKNALRAAKPVVEFELENVLRDAAAGGAADARKIPKMLRERVFPFLGRLESEMDKAHFVKIIAERTGAPTDAVWQDVRAAQEKAKAAAAAASAKSASAAPTAVGRSAPSVAAAGNRSRLDLVERRMFGLLALIESAQLPTAAGYREQIKRIAGDSYTSRIARIEPLLADITFEAEALFGQERDRFDAHMKELLVNFEEDLLNEDLTAALRDLRLAEKAGDQAAVAELAKKCQALSIRKSEIARLRRGA